MLRLPATLGTILTALSRAPSPPAAALSKLLEPLDRQYTRHVKWFAAHGDSVFNVMKELVPNHPFVIVGDARFFRQFRTALCDLPMRADGMPDTSALRAISETYAAGLSQLIARHNVRYVNASWGYQRGTVLSGWRACRSEALSDAAIDGILEAWMPVYEVLFATRDVLGVQAAIPQGEGRLDQENPALRNRLRVGVFAYGGSDVPEAGWRTYGGLRAPADERYADLYVNTGAERGKTGVGGVFGSTRPYGLGERQAIPVPQTSFFAPIALARMVALRGSERYRSRPMSDAAIEEMLLAVTCRARSGAIPACRYQDPLWYDHFEHLESLEPASASIRTFAWRSQVSSS